MIIQAMSWVIECSRHKGSAFVLLLMIANHANREGEHSFPSVPTLAREARIDQRHVTRLLPALEGSGELAVRREATGRGHKLIFALPHVRPWLNGDKLSPFRSQQRATSAPTKSDIHHANPDILPGKDDSPVPASPLNQLTVNEPSNTPHAVTHNAKFITQNLVPIPRRCHYPGCTRPPAERHHVTRYCEEHGDPAFSYLQPRPHFKGGR